MSERIIRPEIPMPEPREERPVGHLPGEKANLPGTEDMSNIIASDDSERDEMFEAKLSELVREAARLGKERLRQYRDHFVYQKIALDDLKEAVSREAEGWNPLMSVYRGAVEENSYWLPKSSLSFLERAFRRPLFSMKPFSGSGRRREPNGDYEISKGDRKRLREALDFLIDEYRTCINAFDTALAVEDFAARVSALPKTDTPETEGQKKVA